MNVNNEKKTLILINNHLPNEIKNIVKEYIPLKIMIFIDKNIYISNHNQIYKYIIKNNYENYVRDILRRDNSFVFKFIFKENFLNWMKIKSYNYKNNIYANYNYFLIAFCIDNECDKCRNIIKEVFDEIGLSKNQHKKNIIKNIRWSN